MGKKKKAREARKLKINWKKIDIRPRLSGILSAIINFFKGKPELKDVAKKGFKFYLLHKKYNIYDFFEPLLALPFAYLVIMLGTGELSQLKLILSAGLVLVYLPLMFYILTMRRK